MIKEMTPYKDSTITQRAALFRVVYGFSFIFLPLVFIGLGFRRDQLPQNIFMFPLWILAIPSISCLGFIEGFPSDPSFSNWRFSTSFLMLGKQLFEPSPHSNKVSYRIFRGILGVFTVAVGFFMFLLMLPLVVLEMIFSQGNSVRQTGPYAKFKPNEYVG
ncbi:MAG: hypothetical protein WCI55_11995 [Armatimonadota bacterium]